MVKTEHFCCAGRHHRELSQLSQDYYAEGTKNDITAISLCDGASFSRFSGLAAQVVSELCVKILLENFERYLTENPFRVRYEIAKKIDIALTRIGKKNNIPLHQLATTILAAAVNPTNGKFLLLHLGDGMIFQRYQESSSTFSVASSPETGLLPFSTYLTLVGTTEYHLRFYRWVQPNQQLCQILLVTDGACDCVLSKPELCVDGLAPIKKHLTQQNPADDYSVASIFL